MNAPIGEGHCRLQEAQGQAGHRQARSPVAGCRVHFRADGAQDFVAVDNPTATKFTFHILAAVAEFERDAISKRTTEALAAAKAKGKVLGNYARIAKGKQVATAARAETVRQRSPRRCICRPPPQLTISIVATSPRPAASAGKRCRSSALASGSISPRPRLRCRHRPLEVLLKRA